MDSRYFVTFEKYLKAGDKAVVYTHGGNFVGIVEFKGNYYFSEEHIGWKKGEKRFLFPYRIKFELLCEAVKPVKIYFSTAENGEKAIWSKPNIIDEITFIADRGRRWNQYVQVSIIRITEEDFNTIEKAIKQSL